MIVNLSNSSSNFVKNYNFLSSDIGALLLNSSNGGVTPNILLKFRFFLYKKFKFQLKLIKRSISLFLFSNIILPNTLKKIKNILVSTNNFFIFFSNISFLCNNFEVLYTFLNEYGFELLCIWYNKKLYSLSLFFTTLKSLKGIFFFSFVFTFFLKKKIFELFFYIILKLEMHLCSFLVIR